MSPSVSVSQAEAQPRWACQGRAIAGTGLLGLAPPAHPAVPNHTLSLQLCRGVTTLALWAREQTLPQPAPWADGGGRVGGPGRSCPWWEGMGEGQVGGGQLAL